MVVACRKLYCITSGSRHVAKYAPVDEGPSRYFMFGVNAFEKLEALVGESLGYPATNNDCYGVFKGSERAASGRYNNNKLPTTVFRGAMLQM